MTTFLPIKVKILYLLKDAPDATGKMIIAEHEKSAEVTVIDIRDDHDYDRIVELLSASDRVISW